MTRKKLKFLVWPMSRLLGGHAVSVGHLYFTVYVQQQQVEQQHKQPQPSYKQVFVPKSKVNQAENVFPDSFSET